MATKRKAKAPVPKHKPVAEMAIGEIRTDSDGNPTHIKNANGRLVYAPGHKAVTKGRATKGLPRFTTAVRRLIDDGLDIEAAVAQAVLAIIARAQTGDVPAFESLMSRLDPDQTTHGRNAMGPGGGGVIVQVVTGIPTPEPVPTVGVVVEPVDETRQVPDAPVAVTGFEDIL